MADRLEKIIVNTKYGRIKENEIFQEIKPRVKYVCYNVSQHKNGQKVIVNQSGLCPQCGLPLKRIISRISL